MKIERIVKEYSVHCESGEAFNLVHSHDDYWELMLEDERVTVAETYDLVRDIFNSEVSEEITTIGIVIYGKVRLTLSRDSTKEEFVSNIMGDIFYFV